MDETFDELVIDVRASTEKFATDLKSIDGVVNSSLLDGFNKAGNTIENSLLSALRRGSLGFDDLKRIAMKSLDEIAAHALTSGLGNLFGSQSGGLAGFLGNSLSALLGLPGRATGGPVSPGRGYIVGERGPELFVPTSSGQVHPAHSQGAGAREVRVAINMAAPRGTSAPVAMRRSSRQVASAIRTALMDS